MRPSMMGTVFTKQSVIPRKDVVLFQTCLPVNALPRVGMATWNQNAKPVSKP